MANILKIKSSNVALREPTSLEYGELAINYRDGKLFYKDANNVIKYFNSDLLESTVEGQTLLINYKYSLIEDLKDLEIRTFADAIPPYLHGYKYYSEIEYYPQANTFINNSNIDSYLGVKKFKYGEIEDNDKVGVVTGLAWTEVGGELLSIETLVMPGKGKLELTGKLGEVMKESMKAAKSFVRSKCLDFGIIPPTFDKKDIHIHVPEGATPKDGPSAGIGMVTSIVSALTGVSIKKDVAMTGEVTLRGRVLPIGGLKEKLLAALRGGIKTAIIPDENEKDLKDIPQNVKDGLKIIPVKNVEEVLKIALTKELIPIQWSEIDTSLSASEASNTNVDTTPAH